MRGFALHCNTVTVRWRRARGVQAFAQLHCPVQPRRPTTGLKRKPSR